MEYRPQTLDYDTMFDTISKHWKDWAKKTNTEKFVIGVSGGKDSSVVATLICRIFGKESLVPVSMPYGEQKDIKDVQELCEWLNISNQLITVNIEEAERAIIKQFDSLPYSEQTLLNIKPRLRMTTLYAVAQSIPRAKVINTCNLSEDVMGWSTLFGDDCGAYAPIRDLTCSEVKYLGKWLGLPPTLWDKTPADGLTDGSDEAAFGVSYLTLDTYIRTGVIEKWSDELNICTRYARNKFKTDAIHIESPDAAPAEFFYNYLKNCQIQLTN